MTGDSCRYFLQCHPEFRTDTCCDGDGQTISRPELTQSALFVLAPRLYLRVEAARMLHIGTLLPPRFQCGFPNQHYKSISVEISAGRYSWPMYELRLVSEAIPVLSCSLGSLSRQSLLIIFIILLVSPKGLYNFFQSNRISQPFFI